MPAANRPSRASASSSSRGSNGERRQLDERRERDRERERLASKEERLQHKLAEMERREREENERQERLDAEEKRKLEREQLERDALDRERAEKERLEQLEREEKEKKRLEQLEREREARERELREESERREERERREQAERESLATEEKEPLPTETKTQHENGIIEPQQQQNGAGHGQPVELSSRSFEHDDKRSGAAPVRGQLSPLSPAFKPSLSLGLSADAEPFTPSLSTDDQIEYENNADNDDNDGNDDENAPEQSAEFEHLSTWDYHDLNQDWPATAATVKESKWKGARDDVTAVYQYAESKLTRAPVPREDRECFLCGERGHQDLDCPQPKKRANHPPQSPPTSPNTNLNANLYAPPERMTNNYNGSNQQPPLPLYQPRSAPLSPPSHSLPATQSQFPQQQHQQQHQQQQQLPRSDHSEKWRSRSTAPQSPDALSFYASPSQLRCLHCAEPGHVQDACPRLKRSPQTLPRTNGATTGGTEERKPLAAPERLCDYRGGEMELGYSECFLCGESGHQDDQCPTRPSALKNNNTSSNNSNNNSSHSPLPGSNQRQSSASSSTASNPSRTSHQDHQATVCFHCDGVGHPDSECPVKRILEREQQRSPSASYYVTPNRRPRHEPTRDSPSPAMNRSPHAFQHDDRTTRSSQSGGNSSGYSNQHTRSPYAASNNVERVSISSDDYTGEDSGEEYAPEKYVYEISCYKNTKRFCVDIQTRREKNIPVEPIDGFGQVSWNLAFKPILSHLASPTVVQRYLIPYILEDGRNFLAIAPPGSGKTVGYLVPILKRLLKVHTESKPRKLPLSCLIVVPNERVVYKVHHQIRQLLENTKFEKLGITVDKPLVTARGFDDLSGCPILVSMPHVLVPLLEQRKLNDPVQSLVFDEAEMMLDESVHVRQLCFHFESLNASVKKLILARDLTVPLFELANRALIDFDIVRVTRLITRLEDLTLLQTEDYEKEDAVRKKLKKANKDDTYVIFMRDPKAANALLDSLSDRRQPDPNTDPSLRVFHVPNSSFAVQPKNISIMSFAEAISETNSNQFDVGIIYDLPPDMEVCYLLLASIRHEATIFYDPTDLSEQSHAFSCHLYYSLCVSRKNDIPTWFVEEVTSRHQTGAKEEKNGGVVRMTTAQMRRLGWIHPEIPKIKGNLFTEAAGVKYITRFDVAINQAKELATIARHFGLPCWNFQTEAMRSMVDCVCSIGGNTIAFALYSGVQQVTSIEIDPLRYEACLKNLDLFRGAIESRKGLPLTSIARVECANFLQVMTSWTPEFVARSAFFFDPPWGGYDYRKHNVINELYLDSEADADDTNADRTISMLAVLKRLMKMGACLIGLKLPMNFNVREYAETICTWFEERRSVRVIITNKFPSQYFFCIARRASARMKA